MFQSGQCFPRPLAEHLHFGDFHGSVNTLLKFYDAHFYIANWGTVRLGLALPKEVIDPAQHPTNAKLSLWQKTYNAFQGMGHYCRICGRSRANEQFSGRGHRSHACKECQRMPREEREGIKLSNELHGFLHQPVISARNVARLKTLVDNEDHHLAEIAGLILKIAGVLPRKRNRWLKLAHYHRPLFDQAIELLGVEFFEELLAGYGDFESPLWQILEQNRIEPRG